MAERKKLAIIDGKSVFYRGYYALPNLSTKDGVPTGGVYGFATMALELLKKLKPDYVAVAWDKPKTNIRARLKMYPDYKAGRKPAPADFYTQIPILHDLLAAFNWPLYELDDYEADDIMGTLAIQAEKKGLETLLITSDLDMLQLVGHNVKVYALKRGFSNIEEFHPASFEAKYGLKPEQFLDLKALKGDSSDNIPGVPGVGEKTAIALLKDYKTLDGVYKNLPKVKETLRKKLADGHDLAYLSKKIAAIWCDAPIKLDLPAMDGTKIDVDHLRSLLQDLEFRSLLRNLPANMQGSEPAVETIAGTKLKLPKNVLIDSDKKLAELKLPNNEQLFIDSRSAGKHGRDPQTLLISADGQTLYILDLTKLNKKYLVEALAKASPLVGYDVKSTLKVLLELGCKTLPTVGHDLLVGAFLLNSLERVQTLTDLAAKSLDYNGASFEDLPPEDFVARAPEILAIIRELYKTQTNELGEFPKLTKLAKDIEWPIIPVLAAMEYAGIKVNPSYLKKFARELGGEISDIEQTIYGLVDEEFNLNSPQQVSRVFFEKLKLPRAGIKKLASGFLSTDVRTLNKLVGKHQVVDEFIRYREYAKLKNTYADVLPNMIDENDRIHTTFNLTIAPTGRLSSADPNLQQIPTKTELGRRIEKGFITEKDNVLVGADYSQFELRLAAAISGDQAMIAAFNKDADIHTETAAQIYNIDPSSVTKAQRSSVKEVNFGIMYGLGPHALSESTGMPFGEARDFIARYFEIRPQLKAYIEKTRKQAENEGYVETLLGRRRPTPDVHSPNFVVREAAYRAAVNMPLQGSAADIMKLAMIEVARKLPASAQMLLQIHDSILIECPKADATKVGKLVKEIMETTYTKLPVKLKADISTGKNWGEL